MGVLRVNKRPCCSARSLKLTGAFTVILYLAFLINAAVDDLLAFRRNTKSTPKNKTAAWPATQIEVADTRLCMGDVQCEESLQENPVFRFVSFKDSTLELYGLDAFDPQFHRIPEGVSQWKHLSKLKMGFTLSRKKHIDPDRDCGLILEHGPVFLDVPVHCSNDFQVYNNNILKHLISAEMAGKGHDLGSITLLQLKPRCEISRVLHEWYKLFADVHSFEKLVKSGERICIKHLQYPRSAMEIFERMPQDDLYLHVPPSKFSQKLVERFQRIVRSHWVRSSAIRKRLVHMGSIKGQVVTFLGKQTSNGQGNLDRVDLKRLKHVLEQRGAQVEILSERRQYRSLQDLWDILGRTSVIIGPHGAALANTIFAPKGALVVELYGDYARNDRSFETMAAYQGQYHVYFNFSGYGEGKKNITESALEAFVDKVVDLVENPKQIRDYSILKQAPFL